jgi:outer membrane protein TolC
MERLRRGFVASIVVATVALVAVTAPLVAQEMDSAGHSSSMGWQPPIYGEPTITLMEAVRLTLENEPNLMLQQQDELFRQGVAQQASGQFDSSLVGSLQWEYTQQELTEQVKKDEREKRDDLAADAVRLGQLAADANTQATEFVTASQALGSGDPSDPGYFEQLRSVRFTEIADQVNWDLLVAMYEGSDATQQDEIRAALDLWVNQRADALVLTAETAEEGRQEAEDQLRKLGAPPVAEKTYKGNLDLQFRTPFRSGIVLSPYLQVNGGGTNYKGKPHDPNFGGKGVTDNYKAIIGFKVDVPLGRGAGPDSTGAAEKAAKIDYDATVAQTTHTASQSVQATLDAYWAMVGAQRNLAVYEKSLELNDRLLKLSQDMVGVDELPRAELARTRARVSETRATVEDARRTLHEARLDFAKTVGLDVRVATQAPLAADGFPMVANALDLDETALSALALESRYDLRAERLREGSTGALVRAAQLDLKRVTNVNVDLSYSGRYEDANVIEGLDGSVLGNYTGPSATVGLNLDWPVQNNVQEGQLAQRTSLHNQQLITSRDLERTIRTDVIKTSLTLEEAAKQVLEYADAAKLYDESLETEIEKFRSGLSTLIDTITTEQRTLNAYIALVGSEQRYAQLLSSLRFQTGTLVEPASDGGFITETDLLSPPSPGAGS